jgi:cardiolipin synthase|tara:strand:- start:2953 stop:3501 length:549 start_codon:yes stop_codon:yes gene_type:complete
MKSFPNILSIIRILSVPFILWLLILDRYLASALIVTIVGLTDFFDGYLARKYNAVSKIGFFLDAIADKSLVVTIYFVIGIKLMLPVYLVILIIFREVLISCSYIFGLILGKKIDLKPIFISKINTFLQILLIVTVCLLAIDKFNILSFVNLFKPALIILVSITTISSSFLYMVMWFKKIDNV